MAAQPLSAEGGFITAQELAEMPDLGPCELIDGRIQEMAPTGPEHGELEAEITFQLRSWAKETDRGRVLGGEVGIYITRDPDTVRAADALYLSHERWQQRGDSAYLDVAPELVVEILSPADRWSDVTEKLQDYFAAGVQRVWILDPRLRQIFVYRSSHESTSLRPGDLLTDAEILPGFELAVGELFGA